MVSIVIPVRNDARQLDVLLRSLAAQDYPADRREVIVVDNGSTDDSREVAETWGATVLCYPDLKVGSLRNRGVVHARGDVLAFVDSDHEVPADWVNAGTRALTLDSSISALGAPCRAPANGTWVQSAWQAHRLRDHSRRRVDWLGSGNMFIRRSDFERIGGFREDLVAAEDVDLCVRLAALQGEIVSDPLVRNVHHGEPSTLRQFFWKEYWRGSSGLRAFFAHGMPLRELPSLLWPLFHLVVGVALLAAIGWSLTGRSWLVPASALLLLVSPSLLLAMKTGWQVRRASAIPALTVLYLTYGSSRAAALFKK